mmetsp:Transcript_8976/g.19505  ORF Transcript_8976/g.19505 Transcript_8976/m.19505 type:complete len:106 (-) Transcript_8976:10-327(-)
MQGLGDCLLQPVALGQVVDLVVEAAVEGWPAAARGRAQPDLGLFCRSTVAQFLYNQHKYCVSLHPAVLSARVHHKSGVLPCAKCLLPFPFQSTLTVFSHVASGFS